MARQSASRILQRYKELQDIIAILGMDEMAEEDKLTVSRAFKMSKDAADLLQRKNSSIDMGRIPGFTNKDLLEKIITQELPMEQVTLY